MLIADAWNHESDPGSILTPVDSTIDSFLTVVRSVHSVRMSIISVDLTIVNRWRSL